MGLSASADHAQIKPWVDCFIVHGIREYVFALCWHDILWYAQAERHTPMFMSVFVRKARPQGSQRRSCVLLVKKEENRVKQVPEGLWSAQQRQCFLVVLWTFGEACRSRDSLETKYCMDKEGMYSVSTPSVWIPSS